MMSLEISNNKRRAEQKMKEIIESYKDINLECDDVLFTDFLDKWLKGIKGIIKPSTWESYDKTVSGKLKLNLSILIDTFCSNKLKRQSSSFDSIACA